MPFASNIVSPTHLLLVLLIVMLVFGTKKLPELGRGMGSAMREFKDGISGRSPAQPELEADNMSVGTPDDERQPVGVGTQS